LEAAEYGPASNEFARGYRGMAGLKGNAALRDLTLEPVELGEINFKK
jgi:hypothetical protein